MPDDRPRIAGIRFRNAGKIFYFHTAGMRLEVGEYVVVETVRGPEIGKVVIAPDQVVVNELGREELKPILRLATESDIVRLDHLRTQADEILPEARRLAEDAGFLGRIDAADYTLDGRRLTFAFASEERLDYRDFVRRSSERFGVKVDMRQVGPRDRAKLAGGYGVCGRELCCSNWLTTFPSISIRMAKEQELPLNPQKISGLCGRLLCCLSYEEEGYKEMRQSLPKLGQRCSTPTGEGRVVAVNILQRAVTLVVDGQRVDVPDRDLGLVVRWDPQSKSGEPPPSISRAEAIAQGMIEATEDDLRAAELAAMPPAEDDWIAREVQYPATPGTGRGRLPGAGQRRQSRPRPAPVEQPRPDLPGTGARRGARPEQAQAPQPRRPAPPANLPEGRIFQRSQPPLEGPTPGLPGEGRRRRGRRGGRGRQDGPVEGGENP